MHQSPLSLWAFNFAFAFVSIGWMDGKLFGTVSLGEEGIRHLSLILADFTALSKVQNGKKKGSALVIQQGNELLGFQRCWDPPFRTFSLGRCFGPPEPSLPVSTGCIRPLRGFVTPISNLRWTNSPFQGKRLAKFEWQNNSIQLQGWAVPATLQPSWEFWTHLAHLGVPTKAKLDSLKRQKIRDTNQRVANIFRHISW